MLAVDGQDAAPHPRGRGHDLLPGHDEDLLARHGEILVGFQRLQGRLQTRGADDGDQHDVGFRQSCQLFQPRVAMQDGVVGQLGSKGRGGGFIAGAELRGGELPGQLQQTGRVVPTGKADDLDLLRQGPGDAHRALADGAGGSQNDDPLLHGCRTKRRMK